MIEASKLKAGMTFESEGKLIRVLEASHHKPERKHNYAYEIA